MAGQSILWYWWEFEGQLLADINPASSKWARFKAWLEKENAQVFTIYPPDQLKAMQQMLGPICDGCGEQFTTTQDENDDPMPLDEEAEEFGWTVDEGSVYCGNCQHLDPDKPSARIDLPKTLPTL